MSVPATKAPAEPTIETPAAAAPVAAPAAPAVEPAAAATPPAQAPAPEAPQSTLLVDGIKEPVQADPSAEQTPAEKTVVPVKYELKLPEGSTLKPSRLEELAATYKDSGVPNEAVQALVEHESEAHAAWREGLKAEAKAQVTDWYKAAESDPEIGGAKFKESVNLANQVVNRFGSDALKAQLNESGLGNHPELMRMISRIGRAMAPDQLVVPGIQAPPEKSAADIFYPNMKKENK